jgi:septum formation protein
MKLILASRSPRRTHLLKELGLEHEVIVSHADEDSIQRDDVRELVMDLAKLKAEIVAKRVNGEAVIIGGDSLVVRDGDVIGKPKNREHAKEILMSLSGREHDVYTGLCVMNTQGKLIRDYAHSKVRFRKLEEHDIERFLDGESLDGAGGYTNKMHPTLFEGIVGSYTNIVGLPTEKLIPMLRDMGVKI